LWKMLRIGSSHEWQSMFTVVLIRRVFLHLVTIKILKI
jgi:hypothetical protein